MKILRAFVSAVEWLAVAACLLWLAWHYRDSLLAVLFSVQDWFAS